MTSTFKQMTCPTDTVKEPILSRSNSSQSACGQKKTTLPEHVCVYLKCALRMLKTIKIKCKNIGQYFDQILRK